MGHVDLSPDLRERLRQIARTHGAVELRLIGSVARGETTENSDIDFLVELEEGRSLMDVGGLLMDLRDELDAEVDLTIASSVPEEARDVVYAESEIV